MNNFIDKYITEPIKTTLNSQKFEHLEMVGQSYTEHLSHAMGYSWDSFKSSVYFFCHGLNPNIFKSNGSDTIYTLNMKIQDKIKIIQERFTRSI